MITILVARTENLVVSVRIGSWGNMNWRHSYSFLLFFHDCGFHQLSLTQEYPWLCALKVCTFPSTLLWSMSCTEAPRLHTFASCIPGWDYCLVKSNSPRTTCWVLYTIFPFLTSSFHLVFLQTSVTERVTFGRMVIRVSITVLHLLMKM